MTSKSTPQYINIQFPKSYGRPVICCPVCGHRPIPRGATAVEPCDHLSFVCIYGSGLHRFEYKSKSFNEKCKLIEDDVKYGEIKELLLGAGFDQRLIIFEADYWGPYTSLDTDLYGYDMANLR